MKKVNEIAVKEFSALGSVITPADLTRIKEEKGIVLYKYLTGFKKIAHGKYENPYANAKPKVTMNKNAIRMFIEERFEALDILAESVIAGNVRAMIVAGAPGVGKTYTLEQRLEAAVATNRIKAYTPIKGSVSPIGLYTTLYENRKSGNVIVLDDIDSVFNDEESLNLLKGALDSSDRRILSWRKDSSYLRDNDVPNSFEYEGQIVFITNIDMESMIERNTKNAAHMGALLSRSVFLDLGIHTNESIMIRIHSVVANTDMVKNLGITKSESVRIVEWMEQNINDLRSISLRTVIQLVGFMKTTSDWQKLARVTMLKRI